MGFSLGRNTTQVTHPLGRVQQSSSEMTPTTFVGGDSQVRKALKEARLGTIDGNRVLSGAPGSDIRIARQNRSGLLNLTSFAQVSRAATQPPQAPIVPQAPVQAQALAPIVAQPPGGGVQPPVVPPDRGQQIGDAIRNLRDGANDRVRAWVTDESAGLSRVGQRGQGATVRSAIYSRAEASQSVHTALQELAKLETEIKRLPGGAAVQDPLLADLRAARVQTMANALRLAMPGLERDGKPPAAEIEHMAERMLVLDHTMQAGAKAVGDRKYTTEKMISVLLGFGNTAELARSPVDARRSDAVAFMTATIDTLVTATSPPRDGSALNSLVGRDAELDEAIRGVRVKATEDVMVQSYRLEHGGEPDGPAMDAIKRQAKEVVGNDMALAKMRGQVHRALGGGYDFSGMTGLRVDAALVKGLREKYGANAREVGVIVAGLMLAQTEALRSTGSTRLLADVTRQLEEQRNVVAQMRQDHRVVLAERSDVRRQLGVQREQLADCDARLSDGVNQGRSAQQMNVLVNQREDVLRRITALERRLGEIDEQLTPLNEAEQHVRFLEEREVSLTPESVLTRARLGEAQQSVTALDARVRQMTLAHADLVRDLTAQSARLAEYRGTLQPGAERDGIGQVLNRIATRIDHSNNALYAEKQHLALAQRTEAYWEGRYNRFQGGSPLGDRYAEVALTGGLTAEELKKLGFDDAQARDILETARGMARQGLSSADQVERIVKDVNAVMAKLSSRRFGVDSALDSQSNTLTGGTNEAKAKNLGDMLVRSLTGDTRTRTSDTAAVRAAVVATLGPYQDAAVDQLGQEYAGYQRDLVGCVDTSLHLDEIHDEMQERIRAFNGAHNGSRDVEHPQGLAVSRNLHEAVQLLQSHGGTMDNAPPEARDRFQQLAKALAGFDANAISVPFFQFNKPALTEQQILQLGQNQELMETTGAILFLRQREPELRAGLQREISETTLALDQVVDLRSRAMGPETSRAVRDTIRAAILEVMPNTPGAVTSFNPAEHAQAIKDKLTSWGFPLDRFGPELTMALGQTFGPAELENWVAGTRLSDRLVESQATERRQRVEALRTESAQGGRDVGIRTRTKEQLLSQVDQMQSGTKVKLTVGDRVEMQTGSIPVEPTGILGVNVKVAVGQMDGIEIARSSDGYELVLRDGWDGRASGELSAKLFNSPINPETGLNVSATASLEGSGYRVTGVSIRTPNTPEGRDAMKAILQSLLTQRQIEPRHLSRAENIMPVVEWKGGVKAGVGAKASVDVKPTDWQGGMAKGSGVGVGARVGLSAAYGYTSYSSGNTNMTVEKRDHEVTVELSGSIGLSGSLGVPVRNMTGKPQTASTDLLGVQASTTFSYKVKGKEVRGPDGLVQPGTEKTRQVLAPSIGKEAVVGRMGGEVFQQVMAAIPPEARESIRTMINASGPGDVISIGYSLDERVRTEANRLLTEAKALRSGAIPSTSREAATQRAEELEGQAQALLDDDDSYIPSKVQLIPTTETLSQLTPLNLVFVNWTAYTEGKGESVAAEVRLDVNLGMNLRAQEVRREQA